MLPSFTSLVIVILYKPFEGYPFVTEEIYPIDNTISTLNNTITDLPYNWLSYKLYSVHMFTEDT